VTILLFIVDGGGDSSGALKLGEELGDFAPLYGPVLLTLGIAALILRWRLPHVAGRAPGTRSVEVTLLAVLLPMLVIFVSAILIGAILIVGIVAACAHGC
jgi:hypothetical protein